jgi:hypothetical protein
MAINHSQKEKQKTTVRMSTKSSFTALAISAVIVLSLIATLQLASNNIAYAQETTEPNVTGICGDSGGSWVVQFSSSNLDPAAEYYFQIIYQDRVRQQGEDITGRESMTNVVPIPKIDYQPNTRIIFNLYENRDLDTSPLSNIEPEELVATASVVCVDTIEPVITVPEGGITVVATSDQGAVVSFEEQVTAEDDVDGPVEVTCTPASGSTFPIGTTTVNCEATDAAGNTSTKEFTVTVSPAPDRIVPSIEITAEDRRSRQIEDGSTTPAPYIRLTFVAEDDVGVESIECSLDGEEFTSCTSPVVYDRLSRGTHEFTVRATDAAGNTGEDQFTWTVSNPAPSRGPPAAAAGEEQAEEEAGTTAEEAGGGEGEEQLAASTTEEEQSPTEEEEEEMEEPEEDVEEEEQQQEE